MLLTLHPRVGSWLQLGGHSSRRPHLAGRGGPGGARGERASPACVVRPGPDLPRRAPGDLLARRADPAFRRDVPGAWRRPAREPVRSDESDDLRWFPVGALPDGVVPDLPPLSPGAGPAARGVPDRASWPDRRAAPWPVPPPRPSSALGRPVLDDVRASARSSALASVTKPLVALRRAGRGRGGRARPGRPGRAARLHRPAPARARLRAGDGQARRGREAGHPADLLQHRLRPARRPPGRGDRDRPARTTCTRRSASRSGWPRPRWSARRTGAASPASATSPRSRPSCCTRPAGAPDAPWPSWPPCSSPGCPGWCPASAGSTTTTGASASRSATRSRRTGPASATRPTTYGHFGRAGTFLWVDPVARLAWSCSPTPSSSSGPRTPGRRSRTRCCRPTMAR